MRQLTLSFNPLMAVLMNKAIFSYDDLIAEGNKLGLSTNLIDSFIIYLKNINGKFDDSTYQRAKAHYRKLTEDKFNQYWNFLKNSNYTL